MANLPMGCPVLPASCLFPAEKLLSFSNIMLWSKWHHLAIRKAHCKGLMLEFTAKRSPLTIFSSSEKASPPDPLFPSQFHSPLKSNVEVSLHKIVYNNTLILLVGFHTFQKVTTPEDFLLLLKIDFFLLCLHHCYHGYGKNTCFNIQEGGRKLWV